MSIEVMSGGMASIDEYMQFQVMKQVNVQSTELTTGYFNANQYPEHILQIALIGFRFTGSTVTTFINEIFAFNEYRDAATINGTYSASSFASATIKKEYSNGGYSFTISNLKTSSGNLVYFYPTDDTHTYSYVIIVRGYNSAQ